MGTLSKIMQILKPFEWGNDEITKFIDTTNENSLATFANLKPEFQKLIEIDKLFHIAKDCAQNSKEYFPALFILKSHSAFLATVKLAIGTQTVESYMTMRGILECSLYGYNIYKNRDLAETWLKRDESPEFKQEVKDRFAIGEIFRQLKSEDESLQDKAKSLYDTTIQYGGHPNEKSLSTVLKIDRADGKITFNVHYLTGDINVIKLSLVLLARVGVIALMISEKILAERFKIIGLSDKIKAASIGL